MDVEYGKTIKCKIKDILRDDINYKDFFDSITRINDITFLCMYFIRYYMLHLFEQKEKLPILDYDFIRMSFKALIKKSKGGAPLCKELKECYKKLVLFYETEFSKNMNCELKDGTGLANIMQLISKDMNVMYTNNIKMNYFKYVRQYVNETYIIRTVKKLTTQEFRELSQEDKTAHIEDRKKEAKLIKIIKSELFLVKNDIIEGTLTSDPKYHKWIEEQIGIIIPNIPKNKKHENYIKLYPFEYLNGMLVMNSYLEKNNKKLFQPLPLRTQLTDCYIPINTPALKDIFETSGSKKTKEDMWSTYFKIDFKKFHIAKYTFNHMISTNGMTVSINFIANDCIESKIIKQHRMAEGSRIAKAKLKGLDEDEKAKIRETKKNINSVKKEKDADIILKKKKEQQQNFKKLTKEEQEKIKLKMKNKDNKCEYIEDALKNEEFKKRFMMMLKDRKVAVGDPGKRAILTILGNGKQHIMRKNKRIYIAKKRKDDVLYSYNTKRRRKEMNYFKYAKLIDNKKKKVRIKKLKKTIKELEVELAKYSSKTTSVKEFIEYGKRKIEQRLYLNSEYNDYIRKLKWWSYIDCKRHESNILNELEEVFGKDTIFVIGDWSKGGKIKYISTPNTKIIRLLKERFEVYLLDETNTSKLNHKTEEEGENLEISVNISYIPKIKDTTKIVTYNNNNYKMSENKTDIKEIYDGKEHLCKNKKICTKVKALLNPVKKYNIKKKLHSVLTFQMSNKRKGCINRDYNSCRNMEKIVKTIVRTGERPVKYRKKVVNQTAKRKLKHNGEMTIELRGSNLKTYTMEGRTVYKNL